MNPLIEMTELCELLPEPDGRALLSEAQHVARESVPPPYQELLVHEHHMTVTMERYHGAAVEVEVLDSAIIDDRYCRKILLRTSDTGRVVQFGIVRFNLDVVTPAVRAEIEAGQTPLGRILIQHNVLRHIDIGATIRLRLAAGLATYFGHQVGAWTFGRMATIFCNGAPAVDLLEISAPLTTGAQTAAE